ncbi:hypothetical protein B9Z48_13755 [Limnohabitans sp. WS1]|nr:hypothetical protein B9Z48_13755 [Limnohabitans sp. WS1]
MGGGLQGMIATRASRLRGEVLHFVGARHKEQLAFVGAPPPGRWLVVCKAYRDEGVAPTGEGLHLWEPGTRNGLHLWEPRPRGDGLWSARLIATRASLPQGTALHFVGAPPPGRWGVVCRA